LKPGGVFRRLWLALLMAAILALIALVATSLTFGVGRVILAAVGLLTLALLAVGLFVAQRPSDVILVMALLPVLILSFGVGLLYGVFVLGTHRPDFESQTTQSA
ncbi:MAG: hypothetical protein GYB68_18950, partial [Chloroflexi bacterium]|nr:hypothetical protein [Chloroflexota bacterium]